MLRQPARQLERRRRLALHPDAQRLEAAQEERGGVGRRDRTRARAELEQPFVVFLAPADEDSEQQVVMAAEELRGAVQDEVRAVLERPQSGSASRPWRPRAPAPGSAAAACEVGEREEGVRRRLQPDQVGASQAARSVWSNSVDDRPQRSRSRIKTPTP